MHTESLGVYELGEVFDGRLGHVEPLYLVPTQVSLAVLVIRLQTCHTGSKVGLWAR